MKLKILSKDWEHRAVHKHNPYGVAAWEWRDLNFHTGIAANGKKDIQTSIKCSFEMIFALLKSVRNLKFMKSHLVQWQNREIFAAENVSIVHKKRSYNNMAFPLQFQAFYLERICLSCMMMIWTFCLAQKNFLSLFFSFYSSFPSSSSSSSWLSCNCYDQRHAPITKKRNVDNKNSFFVFSENCVFSFKFTIAKEKIFSFLFHLKIRNVL